MARPKKLDKGVKIRKDGRFEKRFTFEGKRHSVCAHDLKELDKQYREKLTALENGTYKKNTVVTLNSYYADWFKSRKGTKENTLHNYDSHYRTHIKQALGHRKIKDIERREIIRFQQSLIDKGLSPASVNHVMTVLQLLLNDAVRDEVIASNPAKAIKSLTATVKASETKHRALTIEEQRKLISAFDGDYYKELIEFLLATGMRCGEAAALSWDDVDYKKNVIHVRATTTLDKDGKFVIGSSPKTKAGKRDIPLNSVIRDILTRQRAKQAVISIGCKNVFLSVTGRLLQSSLINKAIARAVNKLNESGANMDTITAHALRATFATRSIESGMNPRTLQGILGHESYKMTMDLYAHVTNETAQAEMRLLENAV